MKAFTAHRTVAADNGKWFAFTVSAAKPQAGTWVATGLTGAGGSGAGGSITITRIFFTVAVDQATVSTFGFDYDYSGVGAPPSYNCSGSATSSEEKPSPITHGQFSTPSETGPWTGAGSGTFRGTFDSAAKAHGSAQLAAFISGPGCMFSGSSQTGTFSWTATRQG